MLAAAVPLRARAAQPRARPVGARAHLPRPRRRHHLALTILLWFLAVPGAAAALPSGDPVASLAGMLGRAAARVRADRLQLADLDRARSMAARGSRWARWARSTRCRHRARRSPTLSPVLAHERPLATAYAARLVRVRAAVPLDPRRRQARDQHLALSAAADGGVPVQRGFAYAAAFVAYRATLWLG